MTKEFIPNTLYCKNIRRIPRFKDEIQIHDYDFVRKDGLAS